jgi:hypothetical protein
VCFGSILFLRVIRCRLPRPHHLSHNRFKQAVDASGLRAKYLDAKVVIGYRRGPWAGAAHYRTLQEQLSMLYDADGPDRPVFTACYDHIVEHYFKGDAPANITSTEKTGAV